MPLRPTGAGKGYLARLEGFGSLERSCGTKRVIRGARSQWG